ncbi:Sec-independent protein translocase TatB [Actinomyces qiguomingii]|uniref:Sec-independent protein translocase TatB n=1 Tax=Actinomyces qiguomingii TaxID=2057800 RepID=UPI000FFF1081|nr:Sec-independent protein translocase TatB [Actinomyces qiguomingii]
MFPGISGAEFFVLLLVLVVVVGPQRLPEYTRKLTQGVRRLRVFLDNAKTQIAEEVGPELSELDLSDLDPRNYDPRKIVRDALGEDLDAIRRDLTNPFQSVLDTAKEASDEAAAAVSGKTGNRSKPLSKMIEDKAEQTRAARAEREKDPQQAAQEAAAVTAELPQVDTVSSTEGQADAAQVDETTESVDATADAARMALESGEVVTAEIPEVSETAEVSETSEISEVSETIGEDAVAADVPSSLAAEQPQKEPTRARRPVSPRDIVRAANEAARTRAEAATAAVA